MSQSTAVRAARPATRPTPAPGRSAPKAPAPRLRVVSVPAHTRSRAGLVVTCLVALVLGLVTLLLLNVSLERGAYELRRQRAVTAQLTDQREALQEQLDRLQAPQSLAAAASALGMVSAPNAAFIRRSDGAILGVPSPGVAMQSPTVTGGVSPSPSASAAPGGASPTPSSSAGRAAQRTKSTSTPVATTPKTADRPARTTNAAAGATVTTKKKPATATTKKPTTRH